MVYINNNEVNAQGQQKIRFYKKRWFKIIGFVLLLALIIGGFFTWKTGNILNKISGGKSGIFSALIHSLPGVKEELKGEQDGRINILLLGMRGENMEGGGLLADTIILASIKPTENKVSMISIPRDLYVTVPDTSDRQKINAVHYYGEQKGRGEGLEAMKKIAGEVTDQPVHYAASINFAGFKQLVDAIGGVDITLEKPFEESMQFNEARACDSVFTQPTGQFEEKTTLTKSGRIRVVKRYPLCTNPDVECGGDFKLPAGSQTLNGDQALCFVRSRKTSSDFERAKRQQWVIQLIKDKMLSVGTLTDFGKINGILDSLGDNVRSDMQLWEMKRLFELYKGQGGQAPQVYQRVLENSEEGLLYHPEESNGAGYILLPIGDNYDRIREMAKNIFELPAQSDIKPKVE